MFTIIEIGDDLIWKNYNPIKHFLRNTQIDFSTIDGNVEFAHSVHLYSDVTSVNSVFVSDKTINNSENLRIKFLSYSKISANLFIYLFFIVCFYILLFNIRKHVN